MPAVIEHRKDNLFLVIEDEGDDRFFWQFQEGARKRTPFASGIADSKVIAQMVDRFAPTSTKEF